MNPNPCGCGYRNGRFEHCAAHGGRPTQAITLTQLAELRKLAERATPGERFQMSGKYMSFDYGETPQVFRTITEADEAFIIALSPEVVLGLIEAAEKGTAHPKHAEGDAC